MSRQFSSIAQALITFVWGKATRVESYEQTITANVSRNTKLKDVVSTAEVRGNVHTSAKDNKMRATMVLKDSQGKRVTTAHVYRDGIVTYSKKEYDQ